MRSVARSAHGRLAPGPELLGSIPTRASQWDSLGYGRFDLLVIGGGITGAGIARDAVMRGLRVALVEKDDFASGTSSRSSRLVHGGLRYLEHGYVKLVFEASHERQTLLRIAPHLVRPLPFTWPIYDGARIGRMKLEAGLILYDALATFQNVHTHRPLGVAGILEREPMLRRKGLRGGAVYYDAATDDARLTLATALDAVRYGGVALNHVTAREYLTDGGTVIGAMVSDEIGKREARVHASVVVDATGPWRGVLPEPTADMMAGRAVVPPHLSDVAIQGTKGVHLAVPHDKVGNRDAVTLLSPLDGRVMFILPSGGTTIIGTTDTVTSKSPDDVRATRDDIRYLLDSANAYLENGTLAETDVIAAWAGIRPLAAGTLVDDPSSASREHSITTREDGVVVVRGGKLTTYRSMAAEVVDCVQEILAVERTTARTEHALLPGGERQAEIQAMITGSAHLGESLSSELSITAAHVLYAAAQECACTLGDVLIRRTHVAFETTDQGMEAAARAADVLGMTGDTKRDALADYAREVERMFTIEG